MVVDTCPNVKKLNLVVHYKSVVLEDESDEAEADAAPPNPTTGNDKCPWQPLSRLEQLSELDLVTMRFGNVRSLLSVAGPSLTTLTLEMGEEQGVGSEIVHLGRTCPNLRVLKLILGDNILKGEMTLHFGSQFFRYESYKKEILHLVGSF